MDTAILKPFPEGNYEPLYVYDQYVITFVTRKKIIGFCNTANVDTSYR